MELQKTVAGNEWFNNFYNSLPECEKSKVKYEKSTSIFRFGDGERVASDQNFKIPTTIGKSHRVSNSPGILKMYFNLGKN